MDQKLEYLELKLCFVCLFQNVTIIFNIVHKILDSGISDNPAYIHVDEWHSASTSVDDIKHGFLL